MRGWMEASHKPVKLLGTSPGAPDALVVVVVVAGVVETGVGVVVDEVTGVVVDEVTGAVVATGVTAGARPVHPNRDASDVARSLPACCQPTTASTRLFGSASPYSTDGSSACTVATMPEFRSWSAAVLATATAVGSLAATPIANASGTPSLVMRPRVDSDGGGADAEVVDPADDGAAVVNVVACGSTTNPACRNRSRTASFVSAAGAVGT